MTDKQTTFIWFDGKQVPLSEFITETEEEKDEKSNSSSKCIKHVNV